MKIDIKNIDRVPFSVLAKPDVTCPFYVGHGKPGFEGFRQHERYCVARKPVALFYLFGQEVLLIGCCARFGVKLPKITRAQLFAQAQSRKIGAMVKKTAPARRKPCEKIS